MSSSQIAPPDLPDPLLAELDALPTLDLEALRLRWRRLTRRPAPPGLRRDLLARRLAYEMQARAYGGLSRETARLLDKLAAGADPGKILTGDRTRRLQPGSQLAREHDGQVHRVTVTADGYLWNGAIYASLSPIAEAITGTRWNGPRFFGLRQNAAAGEATRTAPPSRASASRRLVERAS